MFAFILLVVTISTFVNGFRYTVKVSHTENIIDFDDIYCEIYAVASENTKISHTKTIDLTQQSEWNEIFICDDNMDGNGDYESFQFFCGSASQYVLAESEHVWTSEISKCNEIYSIQMTLYINEYIYGYIFIEFLKTGCDYMFSYPMHGGNIENQQISLNSEITQKNMQSVEQLCVYETFGEFGFMGYVIVDELENGYFADNSGFKSVNINTCELNWRINVSQLFNEKEAMPSFNTPSLFINNGGEKIILYGWNAIDVDSNFVIGDFAMTLHRGCYLAALNAENGSLIWSTTIVDKLDPESAVCMIHGVVIDNGFAYGGVSNPGYGSNPPSPSYLWRGKVFKIDVNSGEIINEWYTLPPYDYDNLEQDGFYNGGSIYPIQSIIDDYFVFGTSNLWSHPKNVEECLLGNFSAVPINNAYPYDMCGNDRSDLAVWRCYEKQNMAQTTVILNKNTFEVEAVIPNIGVTDYATACERLNQYNKTAFDNNQYCSKFNIIPDNKRKYYPENFVISGSNSDCSAVASYHYKGQSYVAVSQKSGAFYVIEVPSGQVKISKIVGPWSNEGGGSPFSLAVDEKNMIAIWSLRGNTEFGKFLYRYKMADDTIVCRAGSIHAIDLKTGYTIWQWINPYGYIGINECNDSKYDGWFPLDGQCEMAFDGTEMLPPNETVINVVTPPINDLMEPIKSKFRAQNVGPVTISNKMVFIPTMTGEVYVHNIFNGDYIDKFHCPDYKIIQNDKIVWNREATRSGITIYDDKILFYCGAHMTHPTTLRNPNHDLTYGQLVVMKLKQQTNKYKH